MNKAKSLHGEYHFNNMVIPNIVSTKLEQEIATATFTGARTITSVYVKLGQISEPFNRATVIEDIIESSNYTPVELEVPSSTDWSTIQDETVALSIRTKEITFAISGNCSYNCFYIVDQDGNLLSVSAKLPTVITQTTSFSGYYKLYIL